MTPALGTIDRPTPADRHTETYKRAAADRKWHTRNRELWRSMTAQVWPWAITNEPPGPLAPGIFARRFARIIQIRNVWLEAAEARPAWRDARAPEQSAVALAVRFAANSWTGRPLGDEQPGPPPWLTHLDHHAMEEGRLELTASSPGDPLRFVTVAAWTGHGFDTDNYSIETYACRVGIGFSLPDTNDPSRLRAMGPIVTVEPNRHIGAVSLLDDPGPHFAAAMADRLGLRLTYAPDLDHYAHETPAATYTYSGRTIPAHEAECLAHAMGPHQTAPEHLEAYSVRARIRQWQHWKANHGPHARKAQPATRRRPAVIAGRKTLRKGD